MSKKRNNIKATPFRGGLDVIDFAAEALGRRRCRAIPPYTNAASIQTNPIPAAAPPDH
ncbi:hypothetical protein [uncultured Dysosmobacter sp.]|uniref:hypothetical protein n=1 Tax=uncultured Dysosmobacter sp. TaxID=2591384 RepID=UPI0026126E16|nr:hypothetical protein [uncultured Dysosmobacter sp.]